MGVGCISRPAPGRRCPAQGKHQGVSFPITTGQRSRCSKRLVTLRLGIVCPLGAFCDPAGILLGTIQSLSG